MTTSAAAAADRSDFRTVMRNGTKLGGITAGAVVVVSLLAQLLPGGVGREAVVAAVVLGAAALVSLLPARWIAPRSVEGIAGAAAVGLWGSVVFSAIDIVLLRPFDHLQAVTHVVVYPWTWDALGGASTWWYLPVWWMLGTFVAWMGGVWTAVRLTPASLGALAAPPLAGGALIAVAGRLAGCPLPLPVTAGAGFVGTLSVLAVAALARRR